MSTGHWVCCDRRALVPNGTAVKKRLRIATADIKDMYVGLDERRDMMPFVLKNQTLRSSFPFFTVDGQRFPQYFEIPRIRLIAREVFKKRRNLRNDSGRCAVSDKRFCTFAEEVEVRGHGCPGHQGGLQLSSAGNPFAVGRVGFL